MPHVEYRLFHDDHAYRIGDDGSVWSRLKFLGYQGRKGGPQYSMSSKWKRLVLCIQGDGYYKVFLRKRRARWVHRLVLESFVGPCPDGMQTRHLNSIPTDNRLENLAWGTPWENVQDQVARGTSRKGENVNNAVLTEQLVLQLRDDFFNGKSFNQLVRIYGFQYHTIKKAVRGTTWGYLPNAVPFVNEGADKDEILDPEYGFDLSLIMD